MTVELKDYLKKKQTIINDILSGYLSGKNPNRIVQAMTYSLMAGGKRLRPILCLAATEAVGGDPDDSLAAACALEMIHTYSLIHDDLPAMDDDEYRRGKPTCHVAFDEATAILAGDALLTLAFQTLAVLPHGHRLPPDRYLEVIDMVSRAAGYQGMVGGQMLDMSSEGQQLSLDELKGLQRLKTGALIEASARAGAVLGNGSGEQLQQLTEYARHIGLAFQVRDDILNIEGDPRITGKAVGTDHSRSKNTFPAVVGLKESKSFARRHVADALQDIENFDNKADPLRAIATYIIERQK